MNLVFVTNASSTYVVRIVLIILVKIAQFHLFGRKQDSKKLEFFIYHFVEVYIQLHINENELSSE